MGGRLTRAAGPGLLPYAAAGTGALAAWLWLAGAAASGPHTHEPGLRGFALAVVMWQAMVVAMMAPVVAPWISAYTRLLAPARTGASAGSVFAFAAGYFTVWLGFSLAAATLQLGLRQMGLAASGVAVRPLAAGLLIGAGVGLFLPARRACLRHCRNPLSYLAARWRNGPPSPLRLGAAHGVYCLGCCWLLMLTGLAMGVMNLAWMAILTAVVVVEQTAPGGEWVGRGFGVVLVFLGVWGLAR